MSRKVAGTEIERLIQLLARLPGLGHRSARKAALALLKRRADLLEPLAAAPDRCGRKDRRLRLCGNIDTMTPCTICRDPQRDGSLIIVVEEIGDLWALERAGAATARYHVLGGICRRSMASARKTSTSPALIERAEAAVGEILLALNATVEGQSTAHYIAEQLAASA